MDPCQVQLHRPPLFTKGPFFRFDPTGSDAKWLQLQKERLAYKLVDLLVNFMVSQNHKILL